jgi:sugar phosphate isomerase/epimerase
MFNPVFKTTNKIVQHIAEISAARELILNASLLPQLELKLQREAIIKMAHHSTSIEGMFDFCKNTRLHCICYDFSHVHKEQGEILNDLKENINNIKIFHISNRVKNSIKQHYPIYYLEEEMALDFDKILSFLAQIKYSGHLVLEYLPQFHPQLLPDGLILKDQYEEN